MKNEGKESNKVKEKTRGWEGKKERKKMGDGWTMD